MFVPRALRLKGVREHPAKPPDDGTAELVLAMEKTCVPTPASPHEHINGSPAIPQEAGPEDRPAAARPRGSKFTVLAATPEYLSQLAAGVELLFTDYAHQDVKSAAWTAGRYRVVNGENMFIHFSAVMEHPNFALMKPTPTQILLRQAVQEHSSHYLELSRDGYHVRRRPSTYPLPFIPDNSFSVVNDDGLSFWGERTIYVETHIRDRRFSRSPGSISQWLKDHGELRQKWLPVQAVEPLFSGCAFITLSGNVSHKDLWNKWASKGKPEYWIVMTKAEHTKRTKEYVELRDKERSRSRAPVEPLKQGQLPKRKHTDQATNDPELNEVQPVDQIDEPDTEPKQKSKRKRRKKFTALVSPH